jgi:hypothetical protein
MAALYVVDVTTGQERTIKRPLLLDSDLVLVGFANALQFHVALFCLVGANPETMAIRRLRVTRLSSPCLKVGGFHPESTHVALDL